MSTPEKEEKDAAVLRGGVLGGNRSMVFVSGVRRGLFGVLCVVVARASVLAYRFLMITQGKAVR